MADYSEQCGYLFAAELQFRLASAVRLAVTTETQPLDLPVLWSYGRHIVSHKEIALKKEQADIAAATLHHSATYLIAVALRDAVKAAYPCARNHADPNVVGAYQISRMIRNAFAHNPFNPIWSIDDDCRDRQFAVDSIISLNTTGLHGMAFDWKQYGGPLALLRLSQFVRFQFLGDTRVRPEERIVSPPQREHYQQGTLILTKVDDIDPSSSES